MTWGKRSTVALNARYSPKRCLDCGEAFMPLSGAAKRCEKCRPLWRKAYRKKWEMVNNAEKTQKRSTS